MRSFSPFIFFVVAFTLTGIPLEGEDIGPEVREKLFKTVIFMRSFCFL